MRSRHEKPRRLWDALDWTDELIDILYAKNALSLFEADIISIEDNIRAEAAEIIESAMQFAAEGGVL